MVSSLPFSSIFVSWVFVYFPNYFLVLHDINNRPSDVASPVDTDGDCVPDSQDLCPTIPGPATNNGCPVTNEVVGGEIIGIDMTSMFVAGAAGNALWILPTAAGIAGAMTAVLVRRKRRI